MTIYCCMIGLKVLLSELNLDQQGSKSLFRVSLWWTNEGEAYQYHWPSALIKGGARETKVHSLTSSVSHRSRLIQMTRLRVDAEVVSGVLRGFQSRLEPVTFSLTRPRLTSVLDQLETGSKLTQKISVNFEIQTPLASLGSSPSKTKWRVQW